VFVELVIRIADRTSRPSPVPRDAAVIKDILDRSIEKNVTLEELSNSIFRSKSQTIRIFKEALGRTPYDYLLGLKLERAKTLLSQTNLSVKEVAFRLKFSDEHYFSRLFKQKAGLSPEIFRRSPEPSLDNRRET
jgi:transcriptional regulator GlxA family with amidase domain